jgi:hypothetical protein
MSKIAYLEKDYEKVGIKKEIQPFEDGLRVAGKKGEYEWWYFDCKFQGGGNLVIVFFSKPMTSFENGLAPYVSIDLSLPEGKGDVHREFACKEGDYSFSTDGCDIRIGECTLKGDLKNYEIYYKDERIEATLSLEGSVPSWRPCAGQIRFGEKDYFAWLPSVPEGKARATVTENGETRTFEGTGYHDHNWGNKLMFFLMHHWYWGRAKIGDYVVVSAFITANKKHGYVETPVFMIAKDGKIIAENTDCLAYEEKDYTFDPVTKKHFAKTIVYDYNEGDKRYKISYELENSIEQKGMKSEVTPLQNVALLLIGLRGSYHRVGGTATIECYEGERLLEKIQAPAIWEQMYFGKDKIRGKDYPCTK